MSLLKIIYVSETIETCDIIKRIILKIKCFFNIIESKNEEGKLIYYLPIFSIENINKRKVKRISKGIIKRLQKDESSNVVLSEYLGKIQELKNNLYSENINILNGRYLFKCLIDEIIDYIIKRQNQDIQTIEASILLNDFNDINKELIIHVAKKIKTLNVITNHIAKCKNIERYLYNEFGILLNVTNNKKVSLLNSKIIFNIDYPSELINQYRIYNNAVIVNILDKIQINGKKFNGVNVSYFKINIPNKYKIRGFKNEEVYESVIYKKDLYKVREAISNDKIKLTKLIGNNGYIKDGELIKKINVA